MEDYKTIKGLRSLPEFAKIIKKITLYSNEKKSSSRRIRKSIFTQ